MAPHLDSHARKRAILDAALPLFARKGLRRDHHQRDRAGRRGIGSADLQAFSVQGLAVRSHHPLLHRRRSGSIPGRFAAFLDRQFERLAGWYERRLHGMLDYRAATLLFAVGILLSVGYLFANTMSELAPEEDQGILFGISKGPQYANLDYIDSFGKQIDETFAVFPETDTRFILTGRSYEVIPQVPRAERLTPESLTNYYVTSGSGAQIPLSTVVSVETAVEQLRSTA